MAEETWRILISEEVTGEGEGGGGGSEKQGEDSSLPPQQKTFFAEMKEYLKKWAPFLIPGGMLYGIYEASSIAKETTRGLFQIVQAMMDLIFLPLMPIFTAIFKAISPLVPKIGMLADAFMKPIVDWLLPKVQDILDHLGDIDWEEQMEKWRGYGQNVAGWLETTSNAIGDFIVQLGTIWGDDDTTLTQKLTATGVLFWDAIEEPVTAVFQSAAAALYEVLSPIGVFLLSHLKVLWFEFVKIDLSLMFQEIFAGVLRFIGLHGRANTLEERMESERDGARRDAQRFRESIEVPESLQPLEKFVGDLVAVLSGSGKDTGYPTKGFTDNWQSIPNYTDEEYLKLVGKDGRTNAFRRYLEGIKLEGIGTFGDDEIQEQYELLKEALGTTTEGRSVVEEMRATFQDSSGKDLSPKEWNRLQLGAGGELHYNDNTWARIAGGIVGAIPGVATMNPWATGIGAGAGMALGGEINEKFGWWLEKKGGWGGFFKEVGGFFKDSWEWLTAPVGGGEKEKLESNEPRIRGGINTQIPITMNLSMNQDSSLPQDLVKNLTNAIPVVVSQTIDELEENKNRGSGSGIRSSEVDFDVFFP